MTSQTKLPADIRGCQQIEVQIKIIDNTISQDYFTFNNEIKVLLQK